MRKPTFIFLILIALLSFSLFAAPQKPSAAAIATSHPLATQAGIRILEQGGNAFDAAVAVGAALAVVEPFSNGVGGSGLWLLRDARQSEIRHIVIDGRERAPLAAHSKMYFSNGQIKAKGAQEGVLSAAIPGQVAGLVYLAEKYGTLPLAKTLAPAIRYANEGFVVDPSLAYHLKKHQTLLHLSQGARQVYFINGEPLSEGAVLKQPALARVLKEIAREGHKGFYQGKIAKEIVSEVNAAGGIWTLEDLAQYRVQAWTPLKGHYRNMEIITAPLPSSGGITLLTTLNILSAFDLAHLSEVDRHHLIIESLRRVHCDRGYYLGDPDFVSTDVSHLISMTHAASLREGIKIDRTTPSRNLDCGLFLEEGDHTTHYSILDQEGNAVAGTLTINTAFGSRFQLAKTGIMLNNGMDDFSLGVGHANFYGLIGQAGNLIASGKKPLSSMTPTFFETPEGIGIVGAQGGSRIPTMVLLALLSAQTDLHPKTWVGLPRFHQQFWPDVVFFEPNAFSSSLQNGLCQRGHMLEEVQRPYGNVQAIFWNKTTDQVEAASDPRKIGLAWVQPRK